LDKVWPLLANRSYKLKIVGPVGAMLERESPELFAKYRQHIEGEVSELVAYYRNARSVIAPMVSGSGISIKTIEALALGMPFVGRSKAYRGMSKGRLAQYGLVPYDGPQAFADAIVETLENEQAAAKKSRAAYEDIFSAAVSSASRDAALRSANVTLPSA